MAGQGSDMAAHPGGLLLLTSVLQQVQEKGECEKLDCQLAALARACFTFEHCLPLLACTTAAGAGKGGVREAGHGPVPGRFGGQR